MEIVLILFAGIVSIFILYAIATNKKQNSESDSEPESSLQRKLNLLSKLPKDSLTEKGKYLFFDCVIVKNSIIELAWMLVDEDGLQVSGGHHFIKGAESIDVYTDFMECFNDTEFVISHNISFDKPILEKEILKHGFNVNFQEKKYVSTKESGSKYCSVLDEFDCLRDPTIRELFAKLYFGLLCFKIEGTRNSASNTLMVYRCFMKMKGLDLITVKTFSIIEPDVKLTLPTTQTKVKAEVFDAFIAIDFETATGKRNSACQLGIVLVEKGVIKERKVYLIQPPNNEYSVINTSIHGLSYKKTENSPTFVELWNDIKLYINNYPIVCHNESFDIDVLRKTCDYYSIPDLSIQKVTCTYQMTGLALIEACQGYGIEIKGHHDALADAEMCANVYLRILEGCEFDHSIVYVKKGGKKDTDPELVETVSKINCGFFVNKGVVITGVFGTFSRDDLRSILQSQGAILKAGISSKVDIVIMGNDAGPAKCAKIKELQLKGTNIEVLDESELLEILNIERKNN